MRMYFGLYSNVFSFHWRNSPGLCFIFSPISDPWRRVCFCVCVTNLLGGEREKFVVKLNTANGVDSGSGVDTAETFSLSSYLQRINSPHDPHLV